MKFGSLQVRTPDGDAREIPIDLPSLVVGRADGNGIVIDDLSISRRHARIIIESGRLLIEDLGSAAGTFVGGHRIDPGVSSLVETDDAIRFGDVEAQFVPAPAGTASDAETGMAALADGEHFGHVEEAPSRAISITLTSPLTPVEPGGAVFATAIIQNRGRVVDLVTLEVTGIPATWVTFSQSTLALVPGTRENITIVIQPPIAAQSLAGEYDFGVVVNSGEHEREGIAFGKVTIVRFEATELSLVPVRSKRDFLVVAKNNGNALATYGLRGVDEEGTFRFEFDQPSIELHPGQERRIPLKVKQGKRKWFGQPSFAPLRIVATPTAGAGVEVDTPGQLVLNPPLQRWKGPAILAFLLGIAAAVLWYSWYYADDMPSWVPWAKDDAAETGTGGEAAFAGVHMCEKTQEDRDKALAKIQLPPAGTTGKPYFAQNNPTWADVEYAKAGDPEFGPDWCGTTIEQCGCAMTSVATIMAMFEIATMPDGAELTPESVNAWFNDEARKTSRGWVSKGYIYGDVIWTSANELSGQIAEKYPGTTTIKFAGFGPGTEEEIKAELLAGRPLVLEVPGHYIAAVGLDGDKILINDPYYADRKTLDAYKGKVKGSVHFEPSTDLSAVVISVPRDLRVRVLDKQGKVVGSLNTDEATSPAPVGIQGAFLSSRDAWRDPTCVESPPPAGAGTTSIFLPGNREDYRIEVLNPSNGGTSVAIHSYDQNGNAAVQTQDSTGPSVLGMAYDPTKAGTEIQVIQGTLPGSESPTPGGPGGTPQLPPGNGSAGGDEDPTPTTSITSPTPGVSPTVTPTRTPQPTPTPVVPQAVTVKCDVAYTAQPKSAGVTCTGEVQGTYTTTRWSINGLPAPVPPGSTAFSTTFSQDTSAIVEMTACNVTVCKSGSVPVQIKFTSPTPTPTGTPVPGTPTPVPTTPPVGPPPSVQVECVYSSSYPGAQIDCSTSFQEAFNSITWKATNASPSELVTGAKHFTTFRSAAGDATVQATVCLGDACTVSNVAVAPGNELDPSLLIDGPTEVCSGPSGTFSLTGYFPGWQAGDPPPTGDLVFSSDDPMYGGPAPIQANAFGGKPGATGSSFYFESAFPVEFTVSYSGDGFWPPVSAFITVSPVECS